MRILQVINNLSTGGAEKLLVDFLPLLKSDKYETDLLILQDLQTPFREELLRQGIRVFCLRKGSIYNPFNIIKLIPWIRKYDVIHTHLFPAQYWIVGAKLLSFSKTPLVTTEHSTYNRRRKMPGMKFIDRWVYSYYQKIITISSATTQNLIAHIGSTRHITTITNGIDIQCIQNALPLIKREICGREDITLVTMVGRFAEAKDQDSVIKAIALLPDKFHLLLVGDGERRKICEQLCFDLNIQNRVHFLGIRTDVPRILKTTDFVVMSSHWEGLGLAAVEGCAAGKPVIASNVPGLGDVVKNAGLVFERRDYKKLAQILAELTANPGLYRQIAYACKERAVLYDIRRMLDRYKEIYRSLID